LFHNKIMHRETSLLSLIILTTGLLAPLHADTVTLANGKVLTGSITEMNATSVSIDSDGVQMTVKRDQIKSIQMGDSAAPTPSAAPTTAPTAPTPAASSLTVPAGTPLIVSLQSTLNSGSAKSGQPFSGVLVSDVRSGNQVVMPAGSPVTGRVTSASRATRGVRKEPGVLNLEITNVTLAGKSIPVSTSTQTQAADRKSGSLAKGAAKGAAGGAIVGALRDGGDAGDGAAGGAAAGAALGFVKPGEDVVISAGSVLSFTLRTAAGP
jgi:hypothetical protein